MGGFGEVEEGGAIAVGGAEEGDEGGVGFLGLGGEACVFGNVADAGWVRRRVGGCGRRWRGRGGTGLGEGEVIVFQGEGVVASGEGFAGVLESGLEDGEEESGVGVVLGVVGFEVVSDGECLGEVEDFGVGTFAELGGGGDDDDALVGGVVEVGAGGGGSDFGEGVEGFGEGGFLEGEGDGGLAGEAGELEGGPVDDDVAALLIGEEAGGFFEGNLVEGEGGDLLVESGGDVGHEGFGGLGTGGCGEEKT